MCKKEKTILKDILVFICVLMLVMPGCMGRFDREEPSKPESEPNGVIRKPYVVVAMIDSGINPYHKVFRRENLTEHPSTFIDGYPNDALPINITFDGEYHGTVDTDEYEQDECWEEIEHGKLYYIPGTNIVGAIGFKLGHEAVPLLEEPDSNPVLDEKFHGTLTTGILTQLCPEAYIVMIDDANFREAVAWAANQSWIDVLSIQRIYYGDFNITNFDTPLSRDITESLNIAWESGKIIIASAGNRPYPFFLLLPAGHPKVIGVGGCLNETKGEVAAFASKMPDFVAQFYDTRLAAHDSVDGYMSSGSGTSLSAPYVSARVASIILNLRVELNDTRPNQSSGLVHGFAPSAYLSDGVLTNVELRDVLNKTAVYWNTTDYNPLNHPNKTDSINDIIFTVTSTTIPILPIAPFLQMGWGYVGPEIVNETVDILLGRKEWKPSSEKQLAKPYMEAIYELRKTIWENYPLTEKEYK